MNAVEIPTVCLQSIAAHEAGESRNQTAARLGQALYWASREHVCHQRLREQRIMTAAGMNWPKLSEAIAAGRFSVQPEGMSLIDKLAKAMRLADPTHVEPLRPVPGTRARATVRRR